MVSFVDQRERGLRIAGTDFMFHNLGAYGLVFRDGNLVRKVARRDHPEDFSRALFEGEMRGHEIAGAIPELQVLVPSNFRRLEPQRIVDRQGRDVTGEFYADLAFEMAFIEGEFRKIGTAPALELKRVFDLFAKHGILGMRDACARMVDERILTVIDFTMQWIEDWE